MVAKREEVIQYRNECKAAISYINNQINENHARINRIVNSVRLKKETDDYLRDANDELKALTLCRRLLTRQLKILEQMNV